MRITRGRSELTILCKGTHDMVVTTALHLIQNNRLDVHSGHCLPHTPVEVNKAWLLSHYFVGDVAVSDHEVVPADQVH